MGKRIAILVAVLGAVTGGVNGQTLSAPPVGAGASCMNTIAFMFAGISALKHCRIDSAKAEMVLFKYFDTPKCKLPDGAGLDKAQVRARFSTALGNLTFELADEQFAKGDNYLGGTKEQFCTNMKTLPDSYQSSFEKFTASKDEPKE